ncbi:hypothetical protein SFRURICE_007777 [Spodoptera frugiperda]|nr:hypothetical protein SFRURICE_007777 [Spodoptera frugiperda]
MKLLKMDCVCILRTPGGCTVHELEESCVRQGGLCVMKSDCPPENIVFLSGTLCPKQQHLGVTCCYL